MWHTDEMKHAVLSGWEIMTKLPKKATANPSELNRLKREAIHNQDRPKQKVDPHCDITYHPVGGTGRRRFVGVWKSKAHIDL